MPDQDTASPVLAGENLYADVVKYCGLGLHRTASQADNATSEWMADEFSRAGLATRFHTYGVRQFMLRDARLKVGGRDVECVPLWPPRPTGATPVEASLARWPIDDVRGRVAVVSLPAGPWGSAPPQVVAKLVNEAAAAGPVAILALTEGPTGEIVALNSEGDPPAWPVPTLIVAPRDLPTLEAAIQSGATAQVLIDGHEDLAAQARNVIGTLPATEPPNGERDLMIVSTPISGWFRCGGERGPGIGVLMGLARWAAARKRPCEWMFLGTSGHELDYAGLRAFMRDEPPPRERVRCWLLMGAGIAAWDWEETAHGLRRLDQADPRRALLCSTDMEPIARAAFADLPFVGPWTDRAAGEQEILLEHNYRRMGMANGHRFHHCPSDGPESTGPALLEPVGRAWARALEMAEAKAASAP